MTKYDKLVRDRIPEILAAADLHAKVRKLEPDERMPALRAKLVEEFAESISAFGHEAALEELADILEVILAIAAEHGATPADLEAARAKKFAERGGFSEGWFLIEVEDKPASEHGRGPN